METRLVLRVCVNENCPSVTTIPQDKPDEEVLYYSGGENWSAAWI